MKSLVVFPDLTDHTDDTNFFAHRLNEEIRRLSGKRIDFVSANTLLQLGSQSLPKSDTSILFHWPETLYTQIHSRYPSAALSLLPGRIRATIVSRTVRQLTSTMSNLQLGGANVVLYFHDLSTFSRIRLIKEIDAQFRPILYRMANTVVFAEDSSRACVEHHYGQCRSPKISHLGNYRELHGEPMDSCLARERLGIPSGRTVIFAFGTLRANRKIASLANLVRGNSNFHLIAAGLGNKSTSESNIWTIGGYVSRDMVNTLISSTDYFVNTGSRYLTSATARVAISYSKPVIACRFGSMIDMCKDCLVDIPLEGELPSSFLDFVPLRGSDEYAAMVKAADKRDSERTWTDAARSILDAVNKVAS